MSSVESSDESSDESSGESSDDDHDESGKLVQKAGVKKKESQQPW